LLRICKYAFFLLILIALPTASLAQQKTDSYITGHITDTSGNSLESIRIRIDRHTAGTTDSKGNFKIKVPSGQAMEIDLVYLNVVKKHISIPALQPDETYTVNEKLMGNFDVGAVVVTGRSTNNKTPIIKVDPSKLEAIPSTNGDISAIVKATSLGVYSNNELSTQYNVRGGNYDENLVYINGIEIYRPQLIRSGQEEGLSVVNTDLVKNLQFSAGGFEAKYGDKMSSVLDIQYKEPDSFAAKVTGSLLGSTISVEDCDKSHRLRFLGGVRYYSNQYLVKSLNVQGQYHPSFVDAQSYLSYELTDRWKIGYLTYYGGNKYQSIPQSQQTEFGTVSQALRLDILFDGQQIMRYNTFLNAFTTSFKPNKNNTLTFISSLYNIDESEDYDIIGQYSLEQLNNDQGSQNFGDVKYSLGNGGYLNHARDNIYSTIYNAQVKGEHQSGEQLNLQWGFKFQHEHTEDKLNDYHYIDSADYSVPQQDTNRRVLNVYSQYAAHNIVDWNRYMGFVENSFNLSKRNTMYMTAGVRGNYWDFNKQFLLSPRIQYYYEPFADYNRRVILDNQDDSLLKNPLRLKAAAGVYQQAPYYREIRDLYGQISPGIKAQKSYQVLAGSELSFKWFNRPFKFITEAYYKYLTDLIPYFIDNEQIRYTGKNDAIGYATGIDMQLQGEVAKENPSWISMSFMKTMQNLTDDKYVDPDGVTHYPGWIPRPTDQRFRFSMYFQDFLPNHPSYKVHLMFVYASGLPFGPPTNQIYQQTLKMPPYRRVDIGFSRLFWDRSKQHTDNPLLKHFRSIWLSAEVFNLFQVNNTISYIWVQDVVGSEYAVPSYLTSRRLNLHLEMKF
jgi:hypothetical protein